MAQHLNPYPAYPHTGKNAPKFSFTCTWPDTDKLMTQGFTYIWGAHFFATYMIDNKPFKWETINKIILKSGMTIKCDDLERIIEHKPTQLEQQWTPPTPYKQMYEAWRNKGHTHIVNLDEVRQQRATTTPDRSEKASARSQEHPGASTSKRLASPVQDRAKPVRASAARSSGLTSIGDIAKALNMHPRDARAILRQTKTPKHEGGWAWPRTHVDKIKAVLTKNKKK